MRPWELPLTAILAFVTRSGAHVCCDNNLQPFFSRNETPRPIIAAPATQARHGATLDPPGDDLHKLPAVTEAGVVASSGGVAVGGERRVELGVGDWIVTQHEPTPAWGK